MKNEYEIIDEYGYEIPKIINKIIKKVLKKEKVKKALFTIIFVDDTEIQRINKEYRNKDSVTDVISFALNDNNDNFKSKINVLGDIYISIPKMQAQAKEYGHTEVRELSFLIVHGLLHLLGYDHIEKEDEIEMFRKQEEVLDGFKETKR
ncbi:MAG: rRNA maturation RNase YbeY [bacterium]